MLKKLGKEKNGEFKASIRAQQQQMQLQSEAQQKQDKVSKSKHNGKAHHGSKNDLDNVSGSSYESGLSRLSSSNDEPGCTDTASECKASLNQEHTLNKDLETELPDDMKKGDAEHPLENEQRADDQIKADIKENVAEILISDCNGGENNLKEDTNSTANVAKEGANVDEGGDQSFRRRASTIVRTSASTLPGVDSSKQGQQPSSTEKDEFKRNINFQRQTSDCGITKINDLNLENLGQDKKIVDSMHWERGPKSDNKSDETSESLATNNADANFSANISKHAEQIRGKMSNLFGRHNPQGSGVNRALFFSEEEALKSSEQNMVNTDRKLDLQSFVSEDSSEYSGFATRSSVSKSRSQSVESDDGMIMFDPMSSDFQSPTKQIKPLPTLYETTNKTPQESGRLLSPSSIAGSPMHKIASSSSMCVPVTEFDPLGALSAAASPTNCQAKSPSRLTVESGLTKSATCPSQSLYQAGSLDSQTAEKMNTNEINSTQNFGSRGGLDENILGSPFANQTNMTRSSTMPVKEQHNVTTTPSSRWALPKSKIASLKKSSNYFQSALSTLSPSTVTKAKTQDVLSSVLSKGQSAYINATSSLSKKVEEIKEYQDQQKLQGPNLSYPGNIF
jgi:hypothetical protein